MPRLEYPTADRYRPDPDEDELRAHAHCAWLRLKLDRDARHAGRPHVLLFVADEPKPRGQFSTCAAALRWLRKRDGA